MKKNLATTMLMNMAALAAGAEPMQITNPDNSYGATTFVSGNFGFRIPMNIPNQRQRRLNERRNPSLRKKRK